jgi:hypothetical protein
MEPTRCTCGELYCAHPWRLTAVPLSDPTETLALIAEHELHVRPTYHGQRKPTGWMATRYDSHVIAAEAKGATIGDAVRACVARIREDSVRNP